ncbi:recQ-mediated genome instability protein 1 [Brachionichthys hirsutus]|uniref:recQ-mediated genome instability protein 1 n=1 Tax=Brachionichthys hirsutus TaxID=412623 RepID=UPI003605201C
MAPDNQAVALATQAWLQSSWYVQVPFAWLEACVQWLQEEAGGAGHLSQQQINQQALDQWLLTDLRDLDYPVLPEGLAQAQKTELSGTFCIQVDSLLDVSQPAYGQLQKFRGADCANDDVSAFTQATQRPWEAKATRMLLMQVTDGVQSLEAMEYQPIPALSTALRPGVKLQLRGQMVCRLGVILLGPSNIKVLGGEVEDLVNRNTQGRVLSRTLGLPEEDHQQQEGVEASPAQHPVTGNHEVQGLEFDDAELVASLEAQEMERVPIRPGQDSGYGTRGEMSVQSSGISSVSRLVSTASFRFEQEDSDHIPSDCLLQQEMSDHNMVDEDFPDEDFEALPLDEFDGVHDQEGTHFTDNSLTGVSQNKATARNLDPAAKTQAAHFEQQALKTSGSMMQRRGGGATGELAAAVPSPFFSPAALEPSRELQFAANGESNFMEETGGPNQFPVPCVPSRDRESLATKTETSSASCWFASHTSRHTTPQKQIATSSNAEFNRLSVKGDALSHSTAPALTVASLPFTYLCLLAERVSKSDLQSTEIHVKAFIVTLLGKLSSSNGRWSVCATISDGTGYLDVELSNEVLTGLLGFSVAEKGVMKRDPARRGELDAGMRRCQEELVDMCCNMTIVVESARRKAVVTKAEAVSEKVLQDLEQRVRDRRKSNNLKGSRK